MTLPFSQEPVEKAIFEALLARRRSLSETGDPLKAKRLLTEIKSLGRAADILLFQGVAEHMNVACDELLGGGVHQRVVLAEAKLRPTFFGKAADDLTTLSFKSKADTQAPFEGGISLEDGGGAGTLPRDGGGAGTLTKDGEEAGTLPRYGGGAGTFVRDGGGAGTLSLSHGGEAGTSSEDGGYRGTSFRSMDDREAPFIIRGAETGQIKIERVDVGQGSLGDGDLSDWSPYDDVAVRQGSAPRLVGRKRHLFSNRKKGG